MIGRNNPFNLRYIPRNQWKGLDTLDPVTKGFCNFIDIDYGIRAAAYLLMVSYRKKGINTIAGIIKRFAPPSENDTEGYIRYVCYRCSLDGNDRLELPSQYASVLYCMSFMEGNEQSLLKIYDIINLFKIKVYGK